jgi:hypothetical protein
VSPGPRRARRTVAIVLGALAMAAPTAAHAKIFELTAGSYAGGMSGWGEAKDPDTAIDFFDRTHGGLVGVEVGAEVLEISALVSFAKVATGDSRGTFTQFLLGFDGEFGVDDLTQPRTFLRLGGFAGVGVGTQPTVVSLADMRRVADHGPVLQATVALDHYILPVLSLGLEARAGYHFFVPGTFSELSGSAQGGHLLLFLVARAHLDPIGK